MPFGHTRRRPDLGTAGTRANSKSPANDNVGVTLGFGLTVKRPGAIQADRKETAKEIRLTRKGGVKSRAEDAGPNALVRTLAIGAPGSLVGTWNQPGLEVLDGDGVLRRRPRP
jgi:hypothetical protein